MVGGDLRADWHVSLPRIAAAAAATPSLRRKQDSILTYAASTDAPTSVPELPPTINKTSLAKLKVRLSERAPFPPAGDRGSVAISRDWQGLSR